MREFLKWAKANGHLETKAVEDTRQVLDQFEQLVKQDLDNLEARLEGLKNEKGFQIFPLSTEMLERPISLTTEVDLKPFDNSILAAVLVRAHGLLKEGETHLAFCELDGDLPPWDKNGSGKPVLTCLYDEARVWVYGDFTMTIPEPPENW